MVGVIDILKENKVIGLVGSKHTGKTTALINFIDNDIITC